MTEYQENLMLLPSSNENENDYDYENEYEEEVKERMEREQKLKKLENKVKELKASKELELKKLEILTMQIKHWLEFPSLWVRFRRGKRSYYWHSEEETFTCLSPLEGVIDVIEIKDAEHFEKAYEVAKEQDKVEASYDTSEDLLEGYKEMLLSMTSSSDEEESQESELEKRVNDLEKIVDYLGNRLLGQGHLVGEECTNIQSGDDLWNGIKKNII